MDEDTKKKRVKKIKKKSKKTEKGDLKRKKKGGEWAPGMPRLEKEANIELKNPVLRRESKELFKDEVTPQKLVKFINKFKGIKDKLGDKDKKAFAKLANKAKEKLEKKN